MVSKINIQLFSFAFCSGSVFVSRAKHFHFFTCLFALFFWVIISPKYLSRISAVSTEQVLPCIIRQRAACSRPVSWQILYLLFPHVCICFRISSISILCNLHPCLQSVKHKTKYYSPFFENSIAASPLPAQKAGFGGWSINKQQPLSFLLSQLHTLSCALVTIEICRYCA